MTSRPAVPELSGVDLGFRPRSYFWPIGLEAHLLARVKGAERKAALKQLIDAGRLNEIPDFLAHSALSEADRQSFGRIHPSFLGGEYLPDLSHNEVMIASITIASTTQDVTSVYARRGRKRIYYRVVDEYGGETLSGRRTRYSTQPLTLGQLEQFFNGAWSIFHVLAMNFDDYDVARMLGFVVRIESSFYPEIAALYGARIEAWATARRAELDSDEIEVEDRESANSAGSSPAMSKAHNLQSNTFPLTSLHEKDRSQSMSTVLAFKNRERSFPAIENGKVAPPRRVTNLERRSREHLTPTEVERLIASAAKAGRHGSRDAMLILVAFRHGLRVGELVTIRWDQVDLQRGTLHVNRKKNGEAGTHPLSGRELRALRQLKRVYPESPFLFVTERGGPITEATVRKLISRAGDKAGLEFPIHPHMLRHATGYYLANNGVDTRTIQAYLGHRNIMHTVRYTQLAPDRFRTLWRD